MLRLLLGGAVLSASGRAASGPLIASMLDRGTAERQVEADGVRLHALVAGDGATRPPVVLIHGASGNARDFTFGSIEAIARRHAVIAFDRPGLGRSDAPSRGADSPFVQAALLSKGLRALGHDRPILVGHSYGGAVALAWALDEPRAIRGLVLLGTPSHVWDGGAGLTNELLSTPLLGRAVAAIAPLAISRDFLDAAATSVFAPQAPPQGYVDRLDPDLLLRPGAIRVNALQLTALKAHIRAMAPRYQDLPMPVQLIHGDRDAIVPLDIHSARFAARVPRSRLTALPGVGHMPHHVAPESLIAALARLS